MVFGIGISVLILLVTTAGLVGQKDAHKMEFTFDVCDELTIRDNETTQVEIKVAGWANNTFSLWFPENIDPLWAQWISEVAHQDFSRTEKDGLLWIFECESGALIEAELIPREESILLETRISNHSSGDIENLIVHNCFHFPKAPDFACDDFSRIYIRTEGEWRSLSNLRPGSGMPIYYHKGFPETKAQKNLFSRMQNIEADHPLIICASKDGKRCVGTASEDFQFLFHNREVEYLRCIHSLQACVSVLGKGEKAAFRQMLYFVDGEVEDCASAFQADVESGRFRP